MLQKPSHKSQPALWHQAVRHIDHITYVGSAEREQSFIAQWQSLGFRETARVVTERYPATHIALTSGDGKDFPWATMTGLSVSEDPDSPVNEFVRRYGEGIQHVAYNVEPTVDMDILRDELAAAGFSFMTPVLTYGDEQGARLRQLFTAPATPFGTFSEFVQRLPGAHGDVYDGFDTRNIDDLYGYYHEASLRLCRVSA